MTQKRGSGKLIEYSEDDSISESKENNSDKGIEITDG